MIFNIFHKKWLVVFLVLELFFISDVFSQASDFREKFDDADYYFLFEEYNKALRIYSELLKKETDNANLNYLVGLCYLQTPKDQDKIKSIPFLEKAAGSINPKYKEGKSKEKQAPPYALYYLGFAYRLNKDYAKAIDVYKKYLSFLKTKDKGEYENTLREIDACEFALEVTKVPVNLEVVNSNQFADSTKKDVELASRDMNQAPVNGDVSNDIASLNKPNYSFLSAVPLETCPVIATDGSFMFFSMGENNVFPSDIGAVEFDNLNYKTDDIFYSEFSNAKWAAPVNMMRQLGIKKQAVPVCLSKDKKELYIVQDDNDNGNIYVSYNINGNWSKIKKLSGKINTREWETHATLSPDSKVLYFTSARKGGYGGLDIYKSIKDDKGKWSKAENLGPIINTPYDEETPVLLDDGKTLFYSSKGHRGMGGFDIFSSTIGGDGKWSTPMNVGYSINTVNNDFAYINKVEEQYAYAPLNRTDLRNEYSGKDDLNNQYKLTINNNVPTVATFTINGVVVFKSPDGSKPVTFDLAVVDSIKGDSIKNIATVATTGQYSLTATSGKYLLNYSAPGYRPFTKVLELPNIYTPASVTINVELVSEKEPAGVLAQSDVIYEYEKKLNRDVKRNVLIDSALIAQNTKTSVENKNSNVTKSDSVLTANNTTTTKLLSDTNLLAGKNESKQVVKDSALVAENKSQNNTKTDLSSSNQNTQKNPDNSDKNAENKSDKSATTSTVNQSKNNQSKSTETSQTDLAENKNNTKNVSLNSAISGKVLVNDVLFDFNSVSPSNFRDNLNNLAAYLKSNKECKIEVNGYSDNQGVEVVPNGFSAKRANYIKEFLIARGAPEQNITANGLGRTKPLADENSEDARKYNRRAEFVIINSQQCANLEIQPIVVPDNLKATSSTSSEIAAVQVDCMTYDFDELFPSAKFDNVYKLYKFLQENPEAEIEVIGHSDGVGTDLFKQRVSERRAFYIKKYLVNSGIAENRISVKGVSDTQKLVADNQYLGNRLNRRVEFKLTKEGKQKIKFNPVIVR